jgi:uncharacterized protein YndB with AHSA1/START domain
MGSSAEFVYTTYIRTTPERLWQAITDPAFSRRYMGHAMLSDWERARTTFGTRMVSRSNIPIR